MLLDLASDKSTQVNGLVPSGNKPLPEPMLTKTHVIIWLHWATMCLTTGDYSSSMLLYSPYKRRQIIVTHTHTHIYICIYVNIYTTAHHQGLDSIWRFHLTSIGNPNAAIRLSKDGRISTLRFLILVRWDLDIESGPCSFSFRDLV